MNPRSTDPQNKETNASRTAESHPDATQREGGDDALAEQNPTAARMDEKVIVNEQSQQKIVNSSSQTGVHAAESSERVDEVQ